MASPRPREGPKRGGRNVKCLPGPDPSCGTRGHLWVLLQDCPPCPDLSPRTTRGSVSADPTTHWGESLQGAAPVHSDGRLGGRGVLAGSQTPASGSPDAQLPGHQHTASQTPSASSPSPCPPHPLLGWQTSSPLVWGHQQAHSCPSLIWGYPEHPRVRTGDEHWVSAAAPMGLAWFGQGWPCQLQQLSPRHGPAKALLCKEPVFTTAAFRSGSPPCPPQHIPFPAPSCEPGLPLYNTRRGPRRPQLRGFMKTKQKLSRAGPSITRAQLGPPYTAGLGAQPLPEPTLRVQGAGRSTLHGASEAQSAHGCHWVPALGQGCAAPRCLGVPGSALPGGFLLSWLSQEWQSWGAA